MGLRERKKARTRQSILASAHDLLDCKDYNDITMEEIACDADISVGTLYNYFNSKGDLLLALILDSDDQYLDAARGFVTDDSITVDERLTDLMVLATEYCVEKLSKSTWRHVSAAALVNSGSDMGRMYAETTRKHLNLVVELMRRLQENGTVRQDIDADAAAVTLFSMKSKMFLDFVSDEDMTLDQHRDQVLSGVRYFLRGIGREVD